MLGNLTNTEIDELLNKSQFGHLGCHSDGKTYVVPISFAFDNTRIVGLTTPGLKVDLMRKNPEVCVCVDDIVSLTNWRSIILWGQFEELEGQEAAVATGLLIDKYGPIFEEMGTLARRGRNVTPDRLDGNFVAPIVYCIRISEKSGRFESEEALT